MATTSKRVFRVHDLAAIRLSARRGLVVSALGALMISFLPALPAGAGSEVHLDTTPAAVGAWLNRLNAWRANAGLPNLTENASWSAGDYNHSLYMVKNDEVAHQEISTHPYYTVSGDTAARNSNIQVSSTTSTTDSQAIDWWMAAPFHAISMMDPLLASTGFGAYRQVKSGWQVGFSLDTSRGRLSSGGKYPVYYPGNGTTEPLRTFGGGEWPDPLQACSGYSAPTGLPVIIQVGSNVSTTAGSVHSFTGNGVALQHCVIDSRNAALGSSLKWHGGVILIPKAPLQNGVKYVVTLTVNSKPYTWSFTVGTSLLPQLAVTGVSPNSGLLAGGTAVTISGRGFSNEVTSVMFGDTPAASFSVVNETTITTVSPPGAGSVDLTVTNANGPSAKIAADQFTYFGVPDPPTAVGATPGNAKVAVHWTAPLSNGGSPITGYRVTPYISLAAQTPQLVGLVSAVLVTGLLNGTAYTFTVAALNAAGASAESNQSNSVIPGRGWASQSSPVPPSGRPPAPQSSPVATVSPRMLQPATSEVPQPAPESSQDLTSDGSAEVALPAWLVLKARLIHLMRA